MPADPEMADVSVIIPAYRDEQSIARALKSVADQTLRPRQAIVVDDGSDDDTYGAAMAMRAQMNGVELIIHRQAHGGAGSARNRALGDARGTFVAFLDADDEWLADKLRQSMAKLEGSDRVLVSHNVLIAGRDGDTLVDCAAKWSGHDAFHILYRKGPISTSTVVARRASVIAAGGFDPALLNAQDFDLWLAVLQSGKDDFFVFDQALTRYHPTEGSVMSHTERRLDCCLKIAARWVPALASHPGSAQLSLAYRVAAVHYEAIRSHAAAGRPAAARWVGARLPAKLLLMGLRALWARPAVRGNFIG